MAGHERPVTSLSDLSDVRSPTPRLDTFALDASRASTALPWQSASARGTRSHTPTSASCLGPLARAAALDLHSRSTTAASSVRPRSVADDRGTPQSQVVSVPARPRSVAACFGSGLGGDAFTPPRPQSVAGGGASAGLAEDDHEAWPPQRAAAGPAELTLRGPGGAGARPAPAEYEAELYAQLFRRPPPQRSVFEERIALKSQPRVAVRPDLALAAAGPLGGKPRPIWLPTEPPAQVSAPTAHPHNSWCVVVQWVPPVDAPEDAEDFPFGYEVNFRSRHSDHILQVTGVSAEPFVRLQDLDPGRSYYFQVRARNDFGPGPWSAWSASYEAPWPPESLGVPPAPGGPPAPRAPAARPATHADESDAAWLEWDEPCSHGAVILGYRVEYGPDPDDEGSIETVTTSNNRTKLRVTGLQPNTVYYFRLCAINDAGDSDWTGWSDGLATRGREPVAPAAPQLHGEVSSRRIAVRWERPESFGFPVKRYCVRLAKDELSASDAVEKHVESDSEQPELHFDDLVPHTAYCFQVRAESDMGSSEWSAQSVPIRTKPDRPGTCGAVKVVANEHKKMHLEWEEPPSHGSDVVGYVLRWSSSPAFDLVGGSVELPASSLAPAQPGQAGQGGLVAPLAQPSLGSVAGGAVAQPQLGSALAPVAQPSLGSAAGGPVAQPQLRSAMVPLAQSSLGSAPPAQPPVAAPLPPARKPPGAAAAGKASHCLEGKFLPGEQVYFQVVAKSAAGNGEFSKASEAVKSLAHVPQQPSPPTFREQTSSSAVVCVLDTCHDSGKPVLGYEAQYDVDPMMPQPICLPGRMKLVREFQKPGPPNWEPEQPSLYEQVVNGFVKPGPYYFRVRAINEIGPSVWSPCSNPPLMLSRAQANGEGISKPGAPWLVEVESTTCMRVGFQPTVDLAMRGGGGIRAYEIRYSRWPEALQEEDDAGGPNGDGDVEAEESRPGSRASSLRPPNGVAVVLLVRKVCFDQLVSSPTLLGQFKARLREGIAKEAGDKVKPEMVDLTIAEESFDTVLVQCALYNLRRGAVVHERLQQADLEAVLREKLAAVSGIDAVTTGFLHISEEDLGGRAATRPERGGPGGVQAGAPPRAAGTLEHVARPRADWRLEHGPRVHVPDARADGRRPRPLEQRLGALRDQAVGPREAESSVAHVLGEQLQHRAQDLLPRGERGAHHGLPAHAPGPQLEPQAAGGGLARGDLLGRAHRPRPDGLPGGAPPQPSLEGAGRNRSLEPRVAAHPQRLACRGLVPLESLLHQRGGRERVERALRTDGDGPERARPVPAAGHERLRGRPDAQLHRITVQLRPPFDGGIDITHYTLHWALTGRWEDGFTTVDNIEGHSYTVEGLQPNTAVFVRVRAVNSIGPGKFSECGIKKGDQGTFQTLAKEPGACYDLSVQAYQHEYSSVYVKWERPLDDGGLPVSRYMLAWSLTPGMETTWDIVKRSCASFKLDGLQPGTDYYFDIRAANNTGYGPFTGKPVHVHTTDIPPEVFIPPRRPKPPKVEVVDNGTTMKLVVTWAANEVYDDKRGFIYSAETQTHMVNTHDLEILGGYEHPEEGVQVFTADAVAQRRTKRKAPNNTNNVFVVTDVYPGRRYQARVRASSDSGVSDWSEPSDVARMPCHTPAVPPAMRCLGLTSTELSLEWEGPDPRGEPVTRFVVRIRQDTRLPGWGGGAREAPAEGSEERAPHEPEELGQWVAEVALDAASVLHDEPAPQAPMPVGRRRSMVGAKYRWTAEGLEPAGSYSAEVRAENLVGLGDAGLLEGLETEPTEPGPAGPPLALAGAADARSVTFSWRGPVYTGGASIEGYDFCWLRVPARSSGGSGAMPRSVEEIVGDPEAKVVEVAASPRSFQAEGLRPADGAIAVVRARSRVRGGGSAGHPEGRGPQARCLVVPCGQQERVPLGASRGETLRGHRRLAPEATRKDPPAPGGYRPFSLSGHWTAPACNGRRITHFDLELQRTDGGGEVVLKEFHVPVATPPEEGDAFSLGFVSDGLPAAARYVLVVRAGNEVGDAADRRIARRAALWDASRLGSAPRGLAPAPRVREPLPSGRRRPRARGPAAPRPEGASGSRPRASPRWPATGAPAVSTSSCATSAPSTSGCCGVSALRRLPPGRCAHGTGAHPPRGARPRTPWRQWTCRRCPPRRPWRGERPAGRRAALATWSATASATRWPWPTPAPEAPTATAPPGTRAGRPVRPSSTPPPRTPRHLGCPSSAHGSGSR
ncbi:unnamed protein product [Prorocentrum cordatum]|uniref:Fibronectin type-III domain-containing protein n=1 Tax=Prorocentrum cordatum TaxID=2364126 RepID=A0ABN9VC30_9DINO|nr:unnamed protein product [Polarella glacialis]